MDATAATIVPGLERKWNLEHCTSNLQHFEKVYGQWTGYGKKLCAPKYYGKYVITLRFWKNQFHSATWKASWRDYIDFPSWLAEPQKPIKQKEKYSTSSHSENKVTNMQGQKDNKDYV